jgi:hypothetical protein
MGYDIDATRDVLANVGAEAVIPVKSNCCMPIPHGRKKYHSRNLTGVLTNSRIGRG